MGPYHHVLWWGSGSGIALIQGEHEHLKEHLLREGMQMWQLLARSVCSRVVVG